MRLSSITPFFIFLTLGLCFITSYCSSNDPLLSLQARRGLRTLDDAHAKINKVDGNAWRSTMSTAYEAINDEDSEIVYHIDYQGVKTHPNPTPKHP
ncbi:hypothetical protein HanRHA438_Chr09g0384461 [Helianthus annuus]|uniref:Uncharacterized protein n=1 Tax=Helianthus annuus TaxID=4232 RepID=A0A251TSW4_HELAN|nr:hypothetical protein HanXRQr2_Chr09g0372541 [Helianthus annuus]KAJ0532879.1 hypothetical protein HanIR_Chr09g0401921 [Helianthus annuus]KAJ0541280.1 hypothetical protein HanHA89_Chr09g0326621 [Helianthus annuus]KAJ0752325.1 hypothetical protein HanPI659440_Chr09g0323051 [Helianthus annuus]KAJ0886885.1 hypothetical protein HanRHA438_Chr09g0384461 [Helianthus annuus]